MDTVRGVDDSLPHRDRHPLLGRLPAGEHVEHLERQGHAAEWGAYAAPFAKLGRMRSAGITDLRDRVFGEGLVPLHSALCEHAEPHRALAFAPERRWITYRTSPLDLLHRRDVYEQIREWLAE